jgi:hypothetical protein
MRTILVHLNVEVPAKDDRPADVIAAALYDAISVGSDDDSVRDLEVVVAFAEEV